MKINFEKLQALGKALMLPIAMLPIAGLLLRLGQPDLLNINLISSAGNVIFSNLPTLFALGIAIGLSKDNHGAAALAGYVGYLIMHQVIIGIDAKVDCGVFGGILIGAIAAALYNKFNDIELPQVLAFFGGRRFVPIITGVSAIIVGYIIGFVWPVVQHGLNTFATTLVDSGGIGLFIFGLCNRLFLVFGLHHVFNNYFWFMLGDFINSSGDVVHGDIARFMAGDKTAGDFMAGYFPIMMFGLPAACLAMYTTAKTENKKLVSGMLLSIALTSVLTGITEPIEYSFLFLSPLLFGVHAVLTGLSFVAVHALAIHLGFSFSAGLIDYMLFYKLATNPLLVIPVGIVFFIIYYVLFVFIIKKMDIKTIGRNEMSSADTEFSMFKYIDALGGKENLVNIDSCTTRLRLTVVDSSIVDEKYLSQQGAKGILAPTKTTLQIIIGPEAENFATKIKEALKSNSSTNTPNSRTNVFANYIVDNVGGIDNITGIELRGKNDILLINLHNTSILNADILYKEAFAKSINRYENSIEIEFIDDSKIIKDLTYILNNIKKDLDNNI